MRQFYAIGKLLTLGFWILPLLALFGAMASPWDLWLLSLGILILVVHLGELALVYARLKAAGRTTMVDSVLVLLVGLFHWAPILRRN
jgi:putative membrane protein